MKAGATGAFLCPSCLSFPQLVQQTCVGALAALPQFGNLSRIDQSLLAVDLGDEGWRWAQWTRRPVRPLRRRAGSDREKNRSGGGNFPQRPLHPLVLHGPKASGLSGEPRRQPGAPQHWRCAQEVERSISV